jgi:hypothetical protein
MVTCSVVFEIAIKILPFYPDYSRFSPITIIFFGGENKVFPPFAFQLLTLYLERHLFLLPCDSKFTRDFAISQQLQLRFRTKPRNHSP